MLLYVAAAFAFLLSILLTFLAPSMGLQGTPLLVARLLFVLLGLAVAGLLLWLAWRKKASATSADGQPLDTAKLDDLLREADRRLAASPQANAKRLRDLPLLYVLGDAGSAKTTVVTKSGLEPELLAGQVYQDKHVVPTPIANLWYSSSTALVEAGEAVRGSAALWKHLVAKTRPGAITAARRAAPFRGAVVCVSCEQFMGAQTTESMQAAAGVLNRQLRELAQQMGASLPVYVLLTKLDRVPGFTEYVRNLSPEEGNVLLGMAPRMTGRPAEEALAAMTGAVDALLFSLGTARLDLLARENDAQQLAPAYQFPRELRRFRNLLSTYLLELNRSSHLSSNPDLRAFCLTGVRPVTIQQVAAAPQAVAPASYSASDATGVFQVPRAAAPAPLQTPSVYGEKTAQWAFLPRFFSDVVLGDKAALGMTAQTGSGRLLKRVLYGSLAGLMLLLLCFFTASYFANRALQERMAVAASTLANARPAGGPVQPDQLRALDQLRSSLVQLEDFHANGAPLRYRWGLYRGDALLQPGRSLYFAHFRDLLLTRTQGEIVAGLTALPAVAAPGADYNTTYAALRAYLITTTNPDKSTAEFLPPVLMTHLQQSGAGVPAEDRALAERQFDYYSRVLPSGDPYSSAPATAAVSRARTYLAGFGGFERIYQGIVSAADKAGPGVRFSAQFPNSVGVLDEPHVIPAAYTKQGFPFMQEALAHPDRYFSGEAWVLGQQAPQSIDTATLTGQLSTRYAADYLKQWSAFLKDAEVVRSANLAEAGKKLAVLTKNDSPLLALLYTVSHNTAVALPDIAASFQSAQAVVPPNNADQYMSPTNKAYVDALLNLSAAVNQVAAAPPDPAATAPVTTAAAAAHLAAQQTAQAFRIDAKNHLDAATLALLEQPIVSAESLVRGLGPAQANAGGKGFCSAYNALLAKAPFNPRATTQAAPAEITALLQPGNGLLWQFYNANLKTLLVQGGTEYASAPNAAQQLNPAFVKFFNRMGLLSQEMFPAGAKDPQFTFTLRNLPSGGVQNSAFRVDGQSLSNTDSQKQFTWNGGSAKEAGLTANNLPLSFNGPWAVFQLVSKAHSQKSANGYDLSFPLELANTPVKAPDGTPVVVRYELSGPGADVLAPGALSSIRCVAEVAR